MTVRVPTRSLTFATLLLAPAMALAQPPGLPPDGGPPRQGRGGMGGPMGMAGPVAGPLMQALDKDRDGALSAEEIRKAPESLRALDRDRDGRIDRSEMRPVAAGRAGQARRGPGGFGPGGRDGDGPDGLGPRPGGSGRLGPGRRGGGPGGGGPDGPPPGPEVGDVLPPFVRQEIRLDAEQRKKIEALETEVRARLREILSREQLRDFEDALRRGPGGPPGGPSDGDGPPTRPGRPE